MAVINVTLANTFEEWRVKTNEISSGLGDLSTLAGTYSSGDVVSAINEIRSDAQFSSPLTITGGGVYATDAGSIELTVNSQTQFAVDANGDCIATRDLSATRNISGVDITASDQLSGNSLSISNNAGVGGTLGAGALNVTGAAAIDGNVTLGNQNTDIITINGDINSTLRPEADSSFDLGTSATRWATAYVDNLNVQSGITTSTVAATGNVAIDGTLNVDGNITLGDSSGDGHTVNGTVTHNNWIRPNADNTITLGASNLRYNNIHSVTFTGTATAAQYADLAEKYLSDMEYEVGTVMSIGGVAEVTAATVDSAHSVLGVVSDKPAYLMNKDLVGGTTVALKGRVPVRIASGVNKGDRLVVSGTPGCAEANNAYGVFSFAIALEDSHGGLVEAVIL